MQEDKLGVNVMPQCIKTGKLTFIIYTNVILIQWLNGKNSLKLFWSENIYYFLKLHFKISKKMWNNFKPFYIKCWKMSLKEQNEILGRKEHESEMEIHQI